MALKVFSRKKEVSPDRAALSDPLQPAPGPGYQPAAVEEPEPDPLQRLYQQHRFAILIGLGDRAANQPHYAPLCDQAEQALEEDLALVPAGLTTLSHALLDEPGAPETEVEVPPFLISMHSTR